MDEQKMILDTLSGAGIAHDPLSMEKHPSQGIMNSVYTVSTDIGELIIHYSRITPTLEHFRTREKLVPVSRFLRSIPGVPAAEVLFTIKLPQHFVSVQKKLPGTPAGTVELADDGVVLTWKVDPDKYGTQVEEIVARVHAKRIAGFGILSPENGEIHGTYPSWREFLVSEIALWIDGIASADTIRSATVDTFTDDARRFFDAVLPTIESLECASLVSCDAMNPSNVLVKDGTVTGIVDWEWAFAADPAWEFCYMNPFPLDVYFSSFAELKGKEAQDAFRLRSEIYEYLIYLMWTYATSAEPTSRFFAANRARAKRKLAQTPEVLAKLR